MSKEKHPYNKEKLRKAILLKTKRIIKDNKLYDYLKDYPWCTGFIGNPRSKVWFVAENPSHQGVKSIHNRTPESERTENLQWNSTDGDALFRAALTEAGFKNGDPEKNVGWRCYITNVVKEIEFVKERNDKKKNPQYWKDQATIWLPLLQFQIDHGNPTVLVAVGKEAFKILKYMKHQGLRAPKLDHIPHYSYIMFRFDSKNRLGPRHPERIKEYKNSIKRIKSEYDT